MLMRGSPRVPILVALAVLVGCGGQSGSSTATNTDAATTDEATTDAASGVAIAPNAEPDDRPVTATTDSQTPVDEPSDAECGNELKTLQVAIEAYYAQTGTYPEDADVMVGDLIREAPRYFEVTDGAIVGTNDSSCDLDLSSASQTSATSTPDRTDSDEPNANTATCTALVDMYAAQEELNEIDFSDPAITRSRIEAYRASLLDVETSAPPEIGVDIELMVDAIDLIVVAFEAAGFDPSKVEDPLDSAMNDSLDAADQRLFEFAETECGMVHPGACRAERKTLETASEAYHAQHGVYPAGVEDLLVDLIREPPQYHDLIVDGSVVARPGAGCE
jgi:hypothetical protein